MKAWSLLPLSDVNLQESAFGLSDEEREYYSLSRRVYSKFAPFYDLVVFPLRKLRRDVVASAGAGRSTSVLDVATGTGEQARAFAEAGCDVVGVDLSPAMLRVARRKIRFSNLALGRADGSALPFEAARFEVSCISFALHEMPTSLRERVLREMVRVTKPEGTLVVVDYALPRSAVARPIVYRLVKLYERDHYAEFVRLDLHDLLLRSGIVVREERRPLLGLVRIVVGARSGATSAPVRDEVDPQELKPGSTPRARNLRAFPAAGAAARPLHRPRT